MLIDSQFPALLTLKCFLRAIANFTKKKNIVIFFKKPKPFNFFFSNLDVDKQFVLLFQHEYQSVIQYSRDHPSLESKCLALFVSSLSGSIDATREDYKDSLVTLESELRPLEKEVRAIYRI